jgi:hypothetical protein
MKYDVLPNALSIEDAKIRPVLAKVVANIVAADTVLATAQEHDGLKDSKSVPGYSQVLD